MWTHTHTPLKKIDKWGHKTGGNRNEARWTGRIGGGKVKKSGSWFKAISGPRMVVGKIKLDK